MGFDYTTVSDQSFSSALDVLNLLSAQENKKNQNHFPGEGRQSPIQSALNILNKAAIEGSEKQKQTLSTPLIKKQIKDLNRLLKNRSAFAEKVKALGFEEQDAASVKGYQIGLPQTKYERMLEAATVVPRVAYVVLATLVTLLFAGIIALPLDQCCDLNPKSSKPPAAADTKDEKPTQGPYQGFEIAGAVCFNSPLRGTPVLDKVFKKEKMDKRYDEMTVGNEWRHKLYTDSSQAEKNGDLNVYTYGSSLDPACHGNCHLLTENPTRTKTVKTEGHHDTMISISAMRFLRKALKEIDPTGKVPVIQLHGSGAGKYQFALFRLVSGRKRTFAVDYAESKFSNHPKTSIAEYAQNDKIQALFKQVYEVTGQKKAILVGHSMGGLVSLEIARNIRNGKK